MFWAFFFGPNIYGGNAFFFVEPQTLVYLRGFFFIAACISTVLFFYYRGAAHYVEAGGLKFNQSVYDKILEENMDVDSIAKIIKKGVKQTSNGRVKIRYENDGRVYLLIMDTSGVITDIVY